jgi:hypothetical protein
MDTRGGFAGQALQRRCRLSTGPAAFALSAVDARVCECRRGCCAVAWDGWAVKEQKEGATASSGHALSHHGVSFPPPRPLLSVNGRGLSFGCSPSPSPSPSSLVVAAAARTSACAWAERIRSCTLSRDTHTHTQHRTRAHNGAAAASCFALVCVAFALCDAGEKSEKGATRVAGISCPPGEHVNNIPRRLGRTGGPLRAFWENRY